MNTFPNRIILFPKDVALITGRSLRTARHILLQIRKKNNKKRGALVTIEEFSDFTGIKKDQIQQFLK